MAKFSGHLGRVGPLHFLVEFDFYVAVLGVGSGPIGFAAPWRCKTLDSQSERSNMGPVPTDVHEILDFRKGDRPG